MSLASISPDALRFGVIIWGFGGDTRRFVLHSAYMPKGELINISSLISDVC